MSVDKELEIQTARQPQTVSLVGTVDVVRNMAAEAKAFWEIEKIHKLITKNLNQRQPAYHSLSH